MFYFTTTLFARFLMQSNKKGFFDLYFLLPNCLFTENSHYYCRVAWIIRGIVDETLLYEIYLIQCYKYWLSFLPQINDFYYNAISSIHLKSPSTTNMGLFADIAIQKCLRIFNKIVEITNYYPKNKNIKRKRKTTIVAHAF